MSRVLCVCLLLSGCGHPTYTHLAPRDVPALTLAAERVLLDANAPHLPSDFVCVLDANELERDPIRMRLRREGDAYATAQPTHATAQLFVDETPEVNGMLLRLTEDGVEVFGIVDGKTPFLHAKGAVLIGGAIAPRPYAYVGTVTGTRDGGLMIAAPQVTDFHPASLLTSRVDCESLSLRPSDDEPVERLASFEDATEGLLHTSVDIPLRAEPGGRLLGHFFFDKEHSDVTAAILERRTDTVRVAHCDAEACAVGWVPSDQIEIDPNNRYAIYRPAGFAPHSSRNAGSGKTCASDVRLFVHVDQEVSEIGVLRPGTAFTMSATQRHGRRVISPLVASWLMLAPRAELLGEACATLN